MVMMQASSSATPSNLSDGWHPAYLLHISKEPTPRHWEMFKQSEEMYRWHVAAWETPSFLQQAPEVQAGITSAKCTPKGRYQASKAWTWGSQILGRPILAGELIDWDTVCPVPCRIKTVKEAGKDFVKILDIEGWPEGVQHQPALQALLLSLREEAVRQPPPVILPDTPQAQAAPPAPEPPKPGMQSWGNVQRPAGPAGPPTPNF